MTVFLLALPAMAAPYRQPPPVAPGRNAPAARAIPTRPIPRAVQKQDNREHLSQWMDRHSNLSLPEMQRALQNEPGFHELPQDVQQRQRDQLARLYYMTPQQRGRMLDRTEALERLTPAQRQQWNGAVQQMNGLPIPRRRLVARAVIDLRAMPPPQRDAVIESPGFRAQFSDPERQMLRSLLLGEPYVGP
jgi:Protein of unknown function (DUF3106)